MAAAQEVLEVRTLLAAFSGIVFRDINENGIRDGGEPASSNATVYLDENENRRLDSNELSTTTSSNGSYVFEGIEPGTKVVRLIPPGEEIQTSPRTLFGTAYRSSQDTTDLFHLNIETGDVLPIGSNNQFRIHGMVVTNDGSIIGTNFSNNHVYNIDPVTGTASILNTGTANLGGGLTHDPFTDTVYSFANDRGTRRLIRIDSTTGIATPIGPGIIADTAVSGLAFDYRDRSIYIFDNRNDRFFRSDLAGNITELAATSEPLHSWSLTFTGTEFWMQQLGSDNETQILVADPLTGQLTEKLDASASIQAESLDLISHGDVAHRFQLDNTTTGINFGHTWHQTTDIEIRQTNGETRISEDGLADTFLVRLTSAPAADLTLTVGPLGESRFELDVTNLTFNESNWNTFQTVTISAIDDRIDSANALQRVQVSAPFSAGIERQTLDVIVIDNDFADLVITESDGQTSLIEGGVSDSVSVHLASQPQVNVVIDLQTTLPDNVTVNPTQLTFTPEDWLTPQTVTLTGTEDTVVRGDLQATLSAIVNFSLSDLAYRPVSIQTIDFPFEDNDEAGIISIPTEGFTQVTEFGSDDEIHVELPAQPLSDVVIQVNATDSSEAIVRPFDLTFTPENWNTPQVVTVIGVNDNDLDGETTSQIRFDIDDDRSDLLWQDVPPLNLNVTTVDNDTRGIQITETLDATQVDESGATDQVFVSLTVRPDSDVVIAIAVDDTSEVSIFPQELRFTRQNWAVPTAVTVTGRDDFIVDGHQTAALTFSVNAADSDPEFANQPDQTIDVSNLDDDANNPVIQTPRGTIDQIQPPILWARVNDADRYQLEVIDKATGTKVIERSVPNNGFQVNQDLPAGEYQIRVRATLRNGNDSQWVDSFFKIAPSVSFLQSDFSHPLRPTISWSNHTLAQSFEIWATNGTTGQQGLIQVSNLNQPQWTPDFDLSGGMYYFWVRPTAGNGFAGDWSSPIRVPVVPEPIDERQASANTTPTFRWSPIPDAQFYELIATVGVQTVAHATNLTQTNYEPPNPLATGITHWWVRAEMPNGGVTPWSSQGQIDIGGSTALSLADSTIDSTPVLRWNEVLGATEYSVYLRSNNPDQPDVYRHQLTAPRLAADALLNGQYTTWIQAHGSLTSRWSEPVKFTVQGGTVNQFVDTTPTDLRTVDLSHTINWSATNGATEYDVYATDGLQQIHQTTSQPSVNITFTTSADWKWWVRPKFSGAIGQWSFGGRIDTSARVLVTSSSTTADRSPLVVWQNVDSASRYDLLIDNLTTRETSVFERSGIAETQLQLPSLAASHYRIWLRAIGSRTGDWHAFDLRIV